MDNVIDVTAKLDVGDNITGLVERLAQQIGITADKVFPWYVKQAVLEGWITVGIITVFFLFALAMFLGGLRKAKWNEPNFASTVTIIGGVLLVVVLFAGSIHIREAITQINNPELHAMREIIKDMSRLLGN